MADGLSDGCAGRGKRGGGGQQFVYALSLSILMATRGTVYTVRQKQNPPPPRHSKWEETKRALSGFVGGAEFCCSAQKDLAHALPGASFSAFIRALSRTGGWLEGSVAATILSSHCLCTSVTCRGISTGSPSLTLSYSTVHTQCTHSVL